MPPNTICGNKPEVAIRLKAASGLITKIHQLIRRSGLLIVIDRVIDWFTVGSDGADYLPYVPVRFLFSSVSSCF